MNDTNSPAAVKAALLKHFPGERIRVCAGKGSHKHGILVFLSKAVRLDPLKMARASAVVEAITGRVEFGQAFRIAGPLLPYYVIQPLTE